MGLQLRVQHALGARLVEIEPRGVENPIIVGRTPGVDVQVPIGTVAGAHCLIYVEQGQWVIQDNGSSGGTYVNGNAISGPVWLNFGDVVSLGEAQGAPTIEIDPMGVAGRQMAGSGRPARPTMQQPQDFYENAVSAGGAPRRADWPVEDDQAADDQTQVDLGVGRIRRPPRRRQANYIGITIVGSVAIVLAGWWVMAKVMKEEEAPPVARATPPEARGISSGNKSIFDFGEGDKAQARTLGEGAILPPVAVPAPEETHRPAAADNDPLKQTEEWKAVVEANGESEKPAKALWAIVDYRRLHPGQFEAELKQYEETALDRLWWERIAELLARRKSAEGEIDKKISEMAQETEVSFKQKLEREIETLSLAARRATETLTQEMGYTSAQPPNVFDAAQLANLRGQRSGRLYEVWKKRVMASVIRTRALPWEQTR